MSLLKIDISQVDTSTPNPKVIWDFFKKRGFSDAGVAGLMGNLYAESGLSPINLQNSYESKLGYTDAEYTAAVDQELYLNFIKDGAGYGLAQWTYWSRKSELLRFSRERGTSIGDLRTQLEYLCMELEKDYKSVYNFLLTAKTVLSASNIVLLEFEKPANMGLEVQKKRAEYGQKYYNNYANKTTSTVLITPPPTNPIETTVTSSKPVVNKNTESSIGGNIMKYSSNNKPLVCMQTNSTCYKQTRTMNVLGVLWHSTGANNPTLKRYVQPSSNDANYSSLMKKLGENKNGNDWNHISHQAGLNAWIGKFADGSIGTVQTMPWNYRPWGCGSGSKGSCNDGWIQFEICEDALTDKAYFNKVYQEAIELTAYLCKMYNLNPKGTVKKNGVNVPVILCHADSYKLGFGGNHGDVYHWFNKHGKTMDDVRNDVAKLMGNTSAASPAVPTAPAKSLYRIRKAWSDAASQKGAYGSLDNAKACCDEAGSGYYVFDEKGVVVYPKAGVVSATLKEGDIISLVPNATYLDGTAVPSWVFGKTLYVRGFRGTNQENVVFSTLATGAITGVVKKTSIKGFEPKATVSTVKKDVPYQIVVDTYLLNVRAAANSAAKITTRVRQGEVYTIVEESNGWGKLKSGAGWISLEYTKRR